MPNTISRALRARTACNLPGLDVVDLVALHCAAVQTSKCCKAETTLRFTKVLRIMLLARLRHAIQVMGLMPNGSDIFSGEDPELYRA